ncbi:MAG: IS4 family transposase [Chloroflexota bacterium]
MASFRPRLTPDPVPAIDAATAAALTAGPLEQELRTLVEGLTPEPATPPGRGRPCILPALALWSAVVVSVLRGLHEQTAIWRRLTELGLWAYPRFPISDQAVYHRLERDGTVFLERLFTRISAILATRLAPYQATHLAHFATGVYALDESTLDQVARRLPALHDVPPGDRQLLPGKLSALFDLRRQQFTRIEHQTNPAQNEKVAARTMVESLGRGALLLADLGYFGFRWFDDLTDQGLWWISRLRAKTSYEIIQVRYDRGGISEAVVWLGAHRSDRAKHAVRLVRFRLGTVEYAYLTNVLDPVVLPIGEIARLYARRWDIELAFRLIKQYLGLHLLWSSKTEVVLIQVWAVLIIAQIVQALRVEIAARAEVDPFEVSLPLLIKYAPQYAALGRSVVDAFVNEGWRMGYLRPSRRTRIEAPSISPLLLTPLPPNLILERRPRYANKDCGLR